MSHRNEKEILAFVQGKGLQFIASDARFGWVDFDPTEQDLAAQDLLSGRGAYEFRIKPRTMKIGSREVEAPVLEPAEGQELWFWDSREWESARWKFSSKNVRGVEQVKRGEWFASQEACKAAYDAYCAALRGES